MGEKVLLAGASGALGCEILKLLHEKHIHVRSLVNSSSAIEKVSPYTSDIFNADASQGKDKLEGLASGIHTVISALGKSVSLFTNRGKTFLENDFYANSNILDAALANGVKRFIYVSIMWTDEASHFEIPRTHKMFEDALKNSGLDYTIIRPVGFFSGLNDLAIMAKRKLIPVVGDGKARTNSIHQQDLARVVVNFLGEGPEMIEVGGPVIHSRMEMAELVQSKIGGKIVKVPEKVADWGMFLPELLDESLSAKLSYFKYITTHDMIGEKKGKITFEEYLNNLNRKDLP
jgi:uncharacterized protein YbjT (DUF2867 family)